MKILLESHAALWFSDDAVQMPDAVKKIIEDTENEKYLSLASIWELAIKFSTGKLAFTDSPEIYLADLLRLNNFQLLSLTFDHVIRSATLPMYHRDPFDSIIIAQSLIESMHVISTDSIFDDYGVTRIW